jgi:subtilisin family serine protease
VYTPYTGSTVLTDDNNHGAHVAGTVAGNSQGWARDATIYNINPYPSNPNGDFDTLIMWDYIRAFHRTKSINPATGKRNPTICNCSYGSGIQFPNTSGYTSGSVTRATYRGTVIENGGAALTSQQLTDAGIYNESGTVVVPFWSAAIEADIEDAIADGIVIVGSAGNDSFLIDRVGGTDYNNNFRATYFSINYTWYYHRGSAPASASNVICVGAVDDTVSETKATFSNCGPRVDVYAPGRYIMSSLNSGTVNDVRNNTYKVSKYSGTSMASPQVCGVLACLLETYPNLTQQEALDWLRAYSQLNQITDTEGSTDDLTSLQGSDNRFLYARKERQESGAAFPKLDYKLRPTSGTVYPRTRINRTP